MHLTHEESAALARRWRASGFTDFEARNELVYGNRGMVVHVVNKVALRNPQFSFDDLVQDGFADACHAANHYDPDRVPYVRFATYLGQVLFRRLIKGLDRNYIIRPPTNAHKCTRPEAVDRARKTRHLTELESELIPGHHGVGEDALETAEDLARLRAAMAQLPATYRENLRLRYGLSGEAPLQYKQIAAMKGHTTQRAQQIGSLALQRLRELLA
jgi:RNA polymerase sigma factor (sigma-70 family)